LRNDKQIRHYQDKFGLLNYQIDFYKTAADLLDLRGKTVLEIGGSDTPVPLAFEELKAKKWVCIDKPGPHYLNVKKSHYDSIAIFDIGDKRLDEILLDNDYVLLQGFTDDITDDFYGQFDAIVSNCCFEHIRYLHDAFEKMYHCLTSGGGVYSAFGPIYSCNVGTHYWITQDINFNANTHKLDLDFAHLLKSSDEIYHMLLPILDREQAEKAAFEIKHGMEQWINYYFYEDYEAILSNAPFSTKMMRPSYTNSVEKSKMDELVQKYPGYSKFDVYSIEMFCRRD